MHPLYLQLAEYKTGSSPGDMGSSERQIGNRLSLSTVPYLPCALVAPQCACGMAHVSPSCDNHVLSNSNLSCVQVSTAVRLCDGAFVVVDAAEGVCVQTHAVLKQAWHERVTPCLLINKVDRLFHELAMDAEAAHARLQQIVDDANGALAALASVEFLRTADELAEDAAFECALRLICVLHDAHCAVTYVRAVCAVCAVCHHLQAGITFLHCRLDASSGSTSNEAITLILNVCSWYEGTAADEDDVFRPATGNVLFASAIDGWAFSVPHFARLYSRKFGFSESALRRALWGPYTFRAKDKQIMHVDKAGGKAKPMFVSWVLAPLVAAYEVLQPWCDGSGVLRKIAASQGLRVPEAALAQAGKTGLQARGPSLCSLVKRFGLHVRIANASPCRSTSYFNCKI
jgi:ribosome assembly protein 1